MSTPAVPAVEEWMDTSEDAAELERAFDDLDRFHQWFLGTTDVCRALAGLVPRGGTATVLDVGCGGGDLAARLVRWARRSGRTVRVTGLDQNRHAARIARRRSTRTRGATPAGEPLRVVAGDAARLPFSDRSFDIVLVSLTLHHFDAAARPIVIAELSRVASRALLINDLLRSRLGYIAARVLAATLWRRSRLTRHDGPVSVQRAFTRDELRHALAIPLLRPARIRQRLLHRLVAVALKADSQDALRS